jgi:alkylated DNA nucleotide flippase Atl1
MTARVGLQVFRLEGGLTGVPQPVEPARFSSLGAREVQHIEEWLKARPDLLGEELRIIASQLTGFDKTQDRPDVLALDREGKLVVIELKRDASGSGQDLQAIRYAAYASTFTADQIVALYRKYREVQHSETLTEAEARSQLEEFTGLDELDALDADPVPRIILVAQKFRPGVTSTALWLSRNFEDFDVSCVRLTPYEVDETLVLTSSVLIPLPEAADYEVRLQEKRRRSRRLDGDTIDFESAKEFIQSIPEGRWASYGDVAAAAGAPRGAQAIGTWLLQTGEEIPNVWRVLRRNGEVSEGWRGELPGVPATPRDVRERLEVEGVQLDPAGKASQEQRWTAEDMASASENGS